jgi:Leucine-rich repeat (LRR) protein
MAATLAVSIALLVGLPATTACAVGTPVLIPDAGLWTAVSNQLGNPVDPITDVDMQSLTELDANGQGISDLTGLEYATNLTSLDLGYNDIIDISAVSGLTKLTSLDVYGNLISDITPVASLTGLTRLWVFSNQITDIAPVAGLTSLTELMASGNQIDDIAPLESLSGLTILGIEDNLIADLAPLAPLTGMTELYANYNQIADISALTDLTSLTSLQLSGNKIVVLTPVSGLNSLLSLRLDGNLIVDVAPLSGLVGLTDLSLENNRITNIAPLAGLTDLIDLWLDNNDIAGITPVAGLTQLASLGLSGNRIADISAASGLTELSSLYVYDNLLTDISALVDLPKLQYLSVAENRLNLTPGSSAMTDIEALLAVVPMLDYEPQQMCTLTVTSGPNGHVSGAAPGSGGVAPLQVYYGTWATYQFMPEAGYHVADVLLDGVSLGPVGVYDLVNISKSHTISATFAPNTVGTAVGLLGPNSVKNKKKLTLKGTVAPSAAPGYVTIYKTRLVGKKWKSMGSASVRVVNGTYSYTYKPTKKGKWRFVAKYPGALSGWTRYVNSGSTVKNVKVR